MILTKEQLEFIVEHAKERYPKEACGILSGKIIDSKKNSSYKLVSKIYRTNNISDTPVNCYLMDPKEQIDIFKKIRKENLKMLGIYHSHPQSSNYPSKRDSDMAFYEEAVYMIISLRNFNKPDVRAFKIEEGKIEEERIIVRKNILFICVENSCRSQIAEGTVNNLYWHSFVAYSAGSKPSGIVNSLAIQTMKEIGIDISNQRSKGFEEVKNIRFDYVITLGCGDVCPVYSGEEKIDWNVEDPKGKPIEIFNKIRDEIQKKIQTLTKHQI